MPSIMTGDDGGIMAGDDGGEGSGVLKGSYGLGTSLLFWICFHTATMRLLVPRLRGRLVRAAHWSERIQCRFLSHMGLSRSENTEEMRADMCVCFAITTLSLCFSACLMLAASVVSGLTTAIGWTVLEERWCKVMFSLYSMQPVGWFIVMFFDELLRVCLTEQCRRKYLTIFWRPPQRYSLVMNLGVYPYWLLSVPYLVRVMVERANPNMMAIDQLLLGWAFYFVSVSTSLATPVSYGGKRKEMLMRIGRVFLVVAPLGFFYSWHTLNFLRALDARGPPRPKNFLLVSMHIALMNVFAIVDCIRFEFLNGARGARDPLVDDKEGLGTDCSMRGEQLEEGLQLEQGLERPYLEDGETETPAADGGPKPKGKIGAKADGEDVPLQETPGPAVSAAVSSGVASGAASGVDSDADSSQDEMEERVHEISSLQKEKMVDEFREELKEQRETQREERAQAQERAKAASREARAQTQKSSSRESRAQSHLPASRALVDHYQVLELAMDASAKDIKRAYHRLSKRWHPDRNDARKVEYNNTQFLTVKNAYDVLSSPHERRLYDLALVDRR